MNTLATSKQAQVIAALVEGTSVNATCRMTGVAKHTVLKLLKGMEKQLRSVIQELRGRQGLVCPASKPRGRSSSK